MIKLIAADLDGTLLTTDKKILPSTIEAIAEARQAGLLFTVATGRPFVSAKRYIDQVGTDIPVVCYNGARIIDPATGDYAMSIDLEPQDARKILELSDKYGVTACVWSAERLYTNDAGRHSPIHEYKKLSGLEPVEISDPEVVISQGIVKIIWFDQVARIQELRGLVDGEHFESLTACISDPEYLEFFNKKVDKGSTLEALANRHGIHISQVAAIGDGENDITMLKLSGLGVAMENAGEAVKAHADHVTDSNDNQGIAKAIRWIIEKNK